MQIFWGMYVYVWLGCTRASVYVCVWGVEHRLIYRELKQNCLVTQNNFLSSLDLTDWCT